MSFAFPFTVASGFVLKNTNKKQSTRKMKKKEEVQQLHMSNYKSFYCAVKSSKDGATTSRLRLFSQIFIWKVIFIIKQLFGKSIDMTNLINGYWKYYFFVNIDSFGDVWCIEPIFCSDVYFYLTAGDLFRTETYSSE